MAAILLTLLMAMAWPGPVSARQGDTVQEIFVEAQRYQLGVDRPQDNRKAVDLYLRVVQQDPGHVDAHYNLAYLCFLQKRYDLAARYYRDVIRLEPQDADAYNNLGTVYERQGKPDLALKFYRRSAELSPSNATPLYNTARILLDRGDANAARQAVESALERDPDNEEVVRLHAKVMGEVGRLPMGLVIGVVGGLASVLLAYTVLLKRKGKRA